MDSEFLFKFASSNINYSLNSGGNAIQTGTRKMKKLQIKSQRGLNMVTKIMAEKLTNALGIYGNYHVDKEDYLKGKINHIVIWADSHMLTKSAIDSAFDVICEYEDKYDSMCICGTIQTRPYLMSDGVTFLHMPVIEVSIRIYEEE